MPTKSLKDKKILVGITGGIAVYKICTLVNQLMREGAQVKVIMTKAATEFVTPLTFQSLLGAPVYLDMFETVSKEKIEHIALADWCDMMVIAPTTANTIGKIALGIADNLLATVTMALPTKTPVLIAPAMNVHMWENEIVQRNISSLKEINYTKGNKKLQKYNFANPDKGKLACGYEGTGRLASVDEIVDKIKKIL